MIALQRAGRRFSSPRAEPVDALRDVTLEVPAGTLFGVVGPNGAGKTTLFALVLGFLRATSGSVRVGGMEPRRWARVRGSAWLPERFTLPAGWRVGAALLALARLEQLGAADARRAADAAIERLELGPHAHKPVGALSRGLLQRLGLAQALLAPRDLVVLDEPTQGLDALWRIRLRSIMTELRAEGRTILLASHELDEVERLADHAAVLRDGRLQEVVRLRGGDLDGGILYRIELERPVDALATAFPDAERLGGDGGRGASFAWRVRVGDTADLTRRLAALIEGGARIAAVRPADLGLEARVRGDAERPEVDSGDGP